MARKAGEVVALWLNRKAGAGANTHSDGKTLCLHGNPIARHLEDGSIEVTTAGWDTSTTKSRLNQIPGVSAYHEKKVLHLNGRQWDGSWQRVDDFEASCAYWFITVLRREKCDHPGCKGYFLDGETGCVTRCDECTYLNGYENAVSDEDIAVAITKGLLPEAE